MIAMLNQSQNKSRALRNSDRADQATKRNAPEVYKRRRLQESLKYQYQDDQLKNLKGQNDE